MIKLLDESMSAWHPRKDKTGGLPNISFILQKPEPLGRSLRASHALFQVFDQPCFLFILFLIVLTFLLTNIFTTTGIVLYLEIQRG